MKYGLAIYSEIKNNSSNFDIITVREKYVYPISIQDVTVDKDGTEKVIYAKYIVFVIVEKSNWTVTQTTAINNMSAAWDAANPSNPVPNGLQLIYDQVDSNLIMKNLEDQITNLRSLWP